MSYKALKAKLLSSWVGKSEKAKVDFAFQITDLMKSKSINKREASLQKNPVNFRNIYEVSWARVKNVV